MKSSPRWLPSTLSLLALLLASAFSLYRLTPPSPKPADAPATEFSAARATDELKKFATAPHPIGSEEHAKVREHLVARLRELGLDPQLQSEKYDGSPRANLMSQGNIINILARLPGARGSGKAIAVAAHYDSVPLGPGASDDGAGVAAILETIRALKAGPPIQNDILFLITDAEEVCLCGAKMFVERHPWAAEVGLVLNFEARGTAGPSIMFQTSPENGWLVERYAAAARHPSASSLTGEVYRRLPNDTDLTEFMKGNMPGLNFAFIKNLKWYHTKFDTVENLDKRTLQHHGDNMLGMVRAFGDLDLANVRDRDLVYFDLMGFFVPRYSTALVWPAFAVAAIAFGVAVALALRSGRASLGGLAAGAALQLLLAVLLALISWTIYYFADRIYKTSPTASPLEFRTSSALFAAFAVGVIALHAAAILLAARRVAPASLALGAAIWHFILAALTTAYLPGASYIFVWPLAFFAIAAAVAFTPRAESPKRDAALAFLGALLAVVIWSPTIYLVFISMTLNMIAAIAFLISLTLSYLAPLAAALSPLPSSS